MLTYTTTSRFQSNIVGCFGGAVKDDHGGAYPLALPSLFRYFRARLQEKNERVYRVRDRLRALPRCLVALLRER